jgi:hypothetical protein
MKILFLDFDGVLNYAQWIYTHDKGQHEYGTDEYWGEHIDPACVALLNIIVQRTGAKVVVSSSWRQLHDASRLEKFLKDKGFIGEVIDVTPRGVWLQDISDWGVRGDEIQRWITLNEIVVEKIAILDDETDMAHLLPKLVKTSWESGLQSDHVEKVIKLLGEKE